LDGPEPEEERVVTRGNSRKDKAQEAPNAKHHQVSEDEEQENES
jgi:hypothetical protein